MNTPITDKIFPYYTDDLGNKWRNNTDAVVAMAHLETQNAALRAHAAGLEATFKDWQKDSAKLAAQFPGVEWSRASDFIPHIAALRAALERAEQRWELVFDGYAVYSALSDDNKRTTSPENVSAVLSALVDASKQDRAALGKEGTT